MRQTKLGATQPKALLVVPAVAADTCAKELFRIVPLCPLLRRFCFHFIYGGQLKPSKNMHKGSTKVSFFGHVASSLKLSTSERLKMTTKATLSNWILWRSLNNSIFGASPHLAWRVAFSIIVLPISHISPPGQGGRRRDVRRSISTDVCRLDVMASQTRTCSRRCSCPALVA